MNDTRTIHLGFYATRANDILNALLTRAQTDVANSKNTFKILGVKGIKLERADDNELIFRCYKPQRWRSTIAFGGWADARVLEHMAWVFKNIVVKELGRQAPDAAWKRNCKATIKVCDVDFNVEEFYCIYDNMRARKGADKRYDAKLVEELRGLPLDPIMTEMKIAQREEIAKLEAEIEETVRKLENERWAEQEKMRKQIAETYAKKVAEAREENARKIAEVRAQMEALTMVA